jgi:undecaprenyl-diphosphatase
VTELFPVSSLGHNVLLPALIGGSWANALNVSAPNSPYLAFIVGLHVATAVAMIAFFWRDWLRIVRGFFSSLRTRSITTPDERLAWMIILATIPVGIVGAALQKEFTKEFAKPELAAAFLAANGVILLVSERMRRQRDSARGAAVPVAAGGGGRSSAGNGRPGGPGWDGRQGGTGWDGRQGGPGWTGGPARPAGGPPPQGYSQQPWQQQWQGPEPWYGQDQRGGPGREQAADPRGRDARDPRRGQQQPTGRHAHDGGRTAGHVAGHAAGHAAGHGHGGRAAARDAERDRAVAADRRLSTIGYKRAVLVGAAQILALLPGISRDGIVTVTGMWRGLSREDAVRFSFLLSAPVILAAGALKAKDLFGPMGTGSHGPMLVGSLLSGIGAYLSIRFLVKYFSEEKSLNPFGIYCLIAGLGSLAYLVLK